MVSLFKELVHEVEVEANNKVMKVNIMYDGNPKLCIGCGDFGHYHGNCQDEAGTGRNWSRFQQGNLPMSMMVPPVQRGGGQSSNQTNSGQRQQQREEGNVERQRNHEVDRSGAQEGLVHSHVQSENETTEQMDARQVTDNIPMDGEGADLPWDDHMLEPIMDLSLELSLPLTDLQAPITSPTIYSSASDGSLQFQNEGVGGWRMAIPDMDVAFDDLELEDMIDNNAHLIQGTLGILGDNTGHGAREANRESQLQPRNTHDSTARASPYTRAALLELQIAGEDETLKESVEKEKGEGEHNKDTVRSLDKGKRPMMIVEGASDDLGDEIARVMTKVDTAMERLQDKEGSKKIRRAIENSSEEVRRLACMLNSSDNIDAIMVKEDGAVVYLSSESSADSTKKKRKRCGREVVKTGSVASRLRKKDKQVQVGDAGTDTNASVPKKKIKKMAVRKIKVSGVRPATSLTLAPPMPGLPTS